MSVRTENAAKAKEWYANVENSRLFMKFINKSVKKTEVKKEGDFYTDSVMSYLNEKVKEEGNDVCVQVVDKTTSDALFSLDASDGPVCVLNFASFFNPGGGFLKGSIAQEESLCHVSGLYSVLSRLKIYNDRANRDKTAPEYENEIIYSPTVPFAREYNVRGNILLADVVTCSAPNCNRVPIAQIDSYRKAIEQRIHGIYTEPYLHGCKVLILGAWGCGVFKNDPMLIAAEFKEMNNAYGSLYSKVIYAIPNAQLYKVFSDVLES